MKRALLMVSFGTSYPETLEKNIAAIEGEAAAAFPGWTVRRAFTSGMILRKLAQRDGLALDDVPAALTRLAAEGFEAVVIQPTHIMNGDEYDKFCAQAAPFGGQFAHFAVGRPLLTAAGDYRAVAEGVMASLPAPAEGEALVFMGHGTGHHANAAYTQLEYVFHDLGWKRVFVGTVEGYPALEEVLRRLKECPAVRRVILHPFMVVAGDHAVNDMAGPEPDSWKSCLERAGYEVTCVLKGLGEYPALRALFLAHAQAAGAGTSVFAG